MSGNTLYAPNKRGRPRTKNTGYKNAATARKTIKAVKSQPKNVQVWTINTLYYRAKHHPYRTEEMEDAMDIFAIWLDKNVQRRSRKRRTRKRKTSKRRTRKRRTSKRK
jgi:hypothetical protein